MDIIPLRRCTGFFYRRKELVMADVKPFRGVRPLEKLVEKIASPPYDVINSVEARRMVQGNEYSFLHITKPEVDLPVDTDLYDDAVYEKAAENLKRFMEKGWLKQDGSPCYYIYRQQMGDHVQTGLVTAASVDDYEKDIIKKHEFTRQDKEDDRTRHVYTLNANTGPVFLTYAARESLDSFVSRYARENKPVYDFISRDLAEVHHTFWVVDDRESIETIRREFSQIPVLYVADGHHRSAAATRVREMKRKENKAHSGQEEYNYFLSVIFPHDQMNIMDYNRVVKDLNGLSAEEFLNALEESFTVEKSSKRGDEARPTGIHRFSVYLKGEWYSLTAREGTFNAEDPIGSLDVAILQNNFLSPVLGIGDPRKDKRIDFVGGIRGMKELESLVDSGEYAVAFALFPTSIIQLMSVADAGKVMPPKSTWFEPKLRSGLCLHLLD